LLWEGPEYARMISHLCRNGCTDSDVLLDGLVFIWCVFPVKFHIKAMFNGFISGHMSMHVSGSAALLPFHAP